MAFSDLSENYCNALIQAEYQNACNTYGKKYNSQHEAYAVLKEEFEEAQHEINNLDYWFNLIWREIKENNKHINEYIETIQVVVKALIKEAAQIGGVLEKFKNTFGEDTNVVTNDEVKE